MSSAVSKHDGAASSCAPTDSGISIKYTDSEPCWINVLQATTELVNGTISSAVACIKYVGEIGTQSNKVFCSNVCRKKLLVFMLKSAIVSGSSISRGSSGISELIWFPEWVPSNNAGSVSAQKGRKY